MLGRMLREDGQIHDSLQLLKSAVAENPLNASLRVELADSYALAGLEDDALRELDAAIRVGPLTQDAYVRKAHILLSRGETDPPIALLIKALSLGGGADAHNMLGTAYARSGKLTDALHEFSAVYRTNPNIAGVRDNMANLWMDMNEFSQAERFCAASAESGRPCSEETLRRLGRKSAGDR
jgi:tetratricopeptide (TPR) repeat protein